MPLYPYGGMTTSPYQTSNWQSPTFTTQIPSYMPPAPIWVKGRTEADNYQLPNGGTVILMDSDTNVFYLKTRDANGIYAPIREFKYEEIQSNQQAQNTVNFATKDDLSNITKSVEELKKMVEDLLK